MIVPAITAAYTALAVIAIGATPGDRRRRRRDADDGSGGLRGGGTTRTRAIVPVHLYGQAADMPALTAIAARHQLAIVEDCCQAHLATCGGVPVGTFGIGGAFSFYPTKNLGALGDGGAAITERSRRWRSASRD